MLSGLLQEMLINLIHDMCSEMTILKLLPQLPGGNVFILYMLATASEQIGSVSRWLSAKLQ